MEKRRFTQLGIPGSEGILKDGILKESIITLSGPTGSGKSTFGMQFLVEGAKKHHEAGLYISLEDSKDSLLYHMQDFGWDLEKLERNKQLFFLDYPVYEVDQFLNKNNAVGEIISTMGIERVVIDSIMPIALAFKTDDERKKAFLSLISNLRKWGTSILIVSEDTSPHPNQILPITKYGIEKLTDGWIHMYYICDEKGNRGRAIEVIKMRGVNYEMKRYALKLSDSAFKIDLKKSIPFQPTRM